MAQSCPNLCNPMDCSTLGLPVLTVFQGLPKFMSVDWWCHPVILSSDVLFFCLQSFPASGTFPMSRLFTSDYQNTGASGSASVFPMSIHGWFSLRLTSLISLLSQGLSGVFSSTTLRRHQFFGSQFKWVQIQALSLVICALLGTMCASVCSSVKGGW